MTIHGIGIGLLAADAVSACEVLCRFDHAGDVAEAFFRLRAQPTALQAIVQRDAAGARAPAHVGGVVLDVAHALHTAGDHHVGGSSLHHHRCAEHRLQAAAATAIQLHAGNLHGKAGLQAYPASYAGRFTAGIGLGEDDVVDSGGVQAALGQYRIDDMCTQDFDREGTQGTAEGADRGAQGGDNCCSSHDGAPVGQLRGWRHLVQVVRENQDGQFRSRGELAA
ncbi:hypothetical protein D3C78_1019440 [compost metagenome]